MSSAKSLEPVGYGRANVCVYMYLCVCVCVCMCTDICITIGSKGLPRRLSGNEPVCSAGDTRDMGSVPGSGRSPGGGHGNPLQYSCLENPWAEEPGGYSPQGCKESQMTEVTEHSTAHRNR